jgi:uncharacterized membrane protein YhaH (DUF805 family)
MLAAYHGEGRSLRNQQVPNISPREGFSMDFAQAIKSCFTQYAGFNGRAPRSEFWWFFLFQVIVVVVASFVSQVIGNIASLALLLPALAVGARRLHDIGRSGWWQLLSFTGIGILVLIYWWVQPSGE